MFEAPDSTPSPRSFDASSLDRMSEAEIDALPFGVIALDDEGTILRFNLYESLLARLDRNQVLGRSFFNEIARCTRGPAFEGRFQAFAAEPSRRSAERFPFVFDFAFGAQDVVVEITRGSVDDRFYLLVNRTRVTSPRAGIPKEILAAEQVALAPGERDLGVRRDASEMRVVEIPWSMLSALRATCERLAPESWPLLCQEWGVQWGRRAAVDLEAEAIQAHARSLRELSMRKVAELFSDHLRMQGWGRTSFDFAASADGLIAMEVERSALSESTRVVGLRAAADTPAGFACHLLAGCLGALLTHVAGRRLVVREVACASTKPLLEGAPAPACCRFVGVAERRRKDLESALESGARDLASVRAALRSSGRGE